RPAPGIGARMNPSLRSQKRLLRPRPRPRPAAAVPARELRSPFRLSSLQRTRTLYLEAVMRHGYLIDMDGVLYRGGALIPGADVFIHELRQRDIPFRLLTNNSQRTRRDVAAKLARLGIDVEEEHVFTSA